MISKALQRKQIPQELSTVSTTTKTQILSFYSATREMGHITRTVISKGDWPNAVCQELDQDWSHC
jgi:hypothetical protein